MAETEFEDHKLLWKFFTPASVSGESKRSLTESHNADSIRITAFIIHCLFSIYGLYGRPFNVSRGEKLSEETVLQDYRELQGQLIEDS
jgi:hypothetical protein